MIKRITIKNLRSIDSTGIDINITTNLVALVGGNNSGKSTILKALDLVLGDKWPSEASFTVDDFHDKDKNNDIEICVYFDKSIQRTFKIDTWYEHKTKIDGFKLEYKTYKKNTDDANIGDLHLDYWCINKKGEIIREPTKAPSKDNPHEFIKSFTQTLRVSKKIKSLVRAVYIPVERDVTKQFAVNYKSLLGSLLKDVISEFDSNDKEIVLSKEEAKLLNLSESTTRKELFSKYIEKANATLNTDELLDITSRISDYMKLYCGVSEIKGFDLSFSIQDYSDQYKNMDAYVTQGKLILPINRMGSGYQNLAIIALFNTFLDLKTENPLFLIEEPEICLHPHLKKYFYTVLKTLGDNGTQVFYGTHSTEFVDILNYRNIKRVIKIDGCTKAYPELDEDLILDFKEDILIKLDTAINNERAELFFAKKVLLVEGYTEKLSYDYLFRLKGIDPNLQDISIIETSGKGDLIKYTKLLSSLNITYVAVYDSDILELTGIEETDVKIIANNTDAERKNSTLETEIPEGFRVCLSPYFEVVAGITNNSTNKSESKPVVALKYFSDFNSYEDVKNKFPKVVNVIEKLLNIK